MGILCNNFISADSMFTIFLAFPAFIQFSIKVKIKSGKPIACMIYFISSHLYPFYLHQRVVYQSSFKIGLNEATTKCIIYFFFSISIKCTFNFSYCYIISNVTNCRYLFHSFFSFLHPILFRWLRNVAAKAKKKKKKIPDTKFSCLSGSRCETVNVSK